MFSTTLNGITVSNVKISGMFIYSISKQGIINFVLKIYLLFTELSINYYFMSIIVQKLGATKLEVIVCPQTQSTGS